MIFHITSRNNWSEALESGEYEAVSLYNEGFIHCSPLEKLADSANNFFKGKTGLVILCIEERRVKANVIWEDLYNLSFKFPHIYGKLNVDAVLQVVDLEANSNGVFEVPKEILLFTNKS